MRMRRKSKTVDAFLECNLAVRETCEHLGLVHVSRCSRRWWRKRKKQGECGKGRNKEIIKNVK